jgi:uncharacterized membrane protein YfcA
MATSVPVLRALTRTTTARTILRLNAIASLAGALVSRDASDQLLLAIFAAFSFFGSVLLVLPVEAQDVAAHEVRVNRALAVALAAFIGAFGGMVGIGAIAFIVAVLVYFLRIPPRIAIGSSLGIGMFGAVALGFSVRSRLRRTHVIAFALIDAAGAAAAAAFTLAAPDALTFLGRAAAGLAASLFAWFSIAEFRAARAL